MRYFRNADELLCRERPQLRRVALEIADAALAAADPYGATRRHLSFDGRTLTAGTRHYALKPDQRIFVVGAGKATFPIAKAIDETIGPRIHRGLIVCKHGQEGRLDHIEMRFASHPLPDENSVAAALAAEALLQQVRPGDVVIACFTGGSSSLFVSPVAGVGLADKVETSRVLLTCGANIVEINAVRKHLSRVKGGRLVRAMPAGSSLINLTVSDVIGDALDYITDPSVSDTSSFSDAQATVQKYGLRERLPPAVIAHLLRADAGDETSKEADLGHLDRNDILVVRGDTALAGAAEAARARGIVPILLSACFEGESRELGRSMASIAKQVLADGNPVTAPCLLIGGGETTVLISPGAKTGSGGPNQEFAAAMAIEIEGNRCIATLGLDTDGTDGPTAFAGALVDGSTATVARQRRIDLHASLANHDVARALGQLGELVVTGATGTNVNDLKLVLIGGES